MTCTFTLPTAITLPTVPAGPLGPMGHVERLADVVRYRKEEAYGHLADTLISELNRLGPWVYIAELIALRDADQLRERIRQLPYRVTVGEMAEIALERERLEALAELFAFADDDNPLRGQLRALDRWSHHVMWRANRHTVGDRRLQDARRVDPTAWWLHL